MGVGCDGGGVGVEGDAGVEEGVCVVVDVGVERRWGIGGEGVRRGGEHGGEAHKGRGIGIVSNKDRPGGDVDLGGDVACFCGVGAIGGKIDGTVGTVGVTIAGTQGVAIALGPSTSIENNPSSPSASSSSSS